MGDVVEIITQPLEPTAFYRVSAGALSFEIKARSGACIGLANTPSQSCEYFISFANSGMISIKGPNGMKVSHRGAYTLSNTQYRRFWVAWDCGMIRAGKGREVSHILSYPNQVTGLKYVVFSTFDSLNSVSWRVELPPLSVIKAARTIPYKPVKGGELRWISAEDQLPDDGVVGGFEGECLYIIRGPHSGSMTPGKFVPSEGVAYVSWGGAANEVPEFEILCGFNFTWVATSGNRIPVNAFVAGYSEVNEENLYIGRVKHMDCVIPGKVQPSHKVCYIAYEDRELPFKDYEILVVPEGSPYTEGDHYFHIDRNIHQRHDSSDDESAVILANNMNQGEGDEYYDSN